MDDINWNIKPAEFLAELGWEFRNKGQWLQMRFCPFCGGGEHRNRDTFAVHAEQGNYICLRGSCGVKGSFWGLIVTQGREPKDYLGERRFEAPKQEKKKKKGWVYGRN